MSSRALQINLAASRVDVRIDPKYSAIQEVMSGFYGLQDGLTVFLKELCHPYKNWQFIVNEARTYSLSYFYVLKSHEKGPEAVRLYIDIALEGIQSARSPENSSEAYKNLYLLWQKIIRESGDEIHRFLPALDYSFNRVAQFQPEHMSVVARSYYQLDRLAETLSEAAPDQMDFSAVNSLLLKYLDYSYVYWLSEKDPLPWLKAEIATELPQRIPDLFEPISHSYIQSCRLRLEKIIDRNDLNSAGVLQELLDLPGYGDFVSHYSEIPEKISEAPVDEKLKNHYQLIYLSHAMSIAGLSAIHEESLREITRIITWLINHEDVQNLQQLIHKSFNILKISVKKFPNTVLMCVLNLGRGVYRTDESDLVNFFNRCVVQLGFQTPDFTGITSEWQIQSNAAHIQNIRTWMELIELKPKWSRKLLSSLIINLSLYGVLIKDTDLFPRDITGLLNSDIQPAYNLVKQLMRLFPAYFNEIGAEGKLRDISTKIDEMSKRQDVLVHFLRKQSHVESSNQIISLIEAILTFWKTRSKEELVPYLPPELYEQIDEKGRHIDGVYMALNHIFDSQGLKKIPDLLKVNEESLLDNAGEMSGQYEQDFERVVLCISLYKLLNQKYCVSFCEINDYVTQAQSHMIPGIDKVRAMVAEPDTVRKISGLLDYLHDLKDLILSPEAFEIREDIYRKRHIAAGIPSMYGSYHEPKFDAMGMIFRVEALVNTLFEKLIAECDLDFITRATFFQINDYLRLFRQALDIEGIATREFDQQLELLDRSLKVKLFTFTQYLDIFRGFTQVVRNIVSDYFNNIHKENLREIVPALSMERLLPKYLHGPVRRKELFHKVSEIFLRDVIASSLGLQRLDLFLARIVNTLYKQAEKLPVDKHYQLLTYNPRNIVVSLSERNSKVSDIVHLGNKGFNIVKMKALGLQVPAGFIVTTEVFKCHELVEAYPPAQNDFREQVDRAMQELEQLTSRRFGNPDNPLLVSVRSGSVVSLPGMMDSYLNVGMNEGIVQGIIRQTGEEWFVWDCYRRFLQSYGMSFGIVRDKFDSIIGEFKNKYGVPLKRDFAPAQMKEVAMAYKLYVESKGFTVEESPRQQLYIAIHRVLNSWNSDKARTYRKILGISDDWGTSVTVQAMVFGNLSQQSGSGVLFTHSPKLAADLLRPWGDYTIGNQGEDVVSGLVITYPISDFQAKMENRPVEHALENLFPRIYHALRDIAKSLIYDQQWSPQDIEFTFEGPEEHQLFILQTRDMEMRERKRFASFESTSEMSEKLLGHGIGVSGGAMAGRAVFALDDIKYWREREPGTNLILVRGDTVPEDINEISSTDGLFTARGGATSHAAIVANRLDKTCVVGCAELKCFEQEKKFMMNGKTVHSGDFISIDGSEGSIYLGIMKVNKGETEL